MKNVKTLIAIMFSTAMLLGCSMGSLMIHERQSPFGFEKTVEIIQENVKKEGWILTKVYDFQKSLVKHKQPDPGKIKLLKLCHPEIAGRMLGQDDHKYVSVMMPCSVSVYQKKDGHTYVASMNMGLMSMVMGSEVGAILKRVAEEDERILGFLGQ
jgi:uncharacterized protein (DUF302 family)